MLMKWLVLPLLFTTTAMAAVQREPYSDDPVIIRDTDVAEGVEEQEPPKERDPAEAKKNMDVGNFYSKQGNYVGAIGRYLTALEYQPDLSKAYKAFEQAYTSLLKSLDDEQQEPVKIKRAIEDTEPDRSEKIAQTIGLVEGYLRSNPDSARREELRKKIETLHDKAAQSTE
jgi:tetratricopeptide (TPR) repeat protein